MFGTVLMGLLIVFIVWDILYRRRRHGPLVKAGVPGFIPWPLVGSNIFPLLGKDSRHQFVLIKALHKKFGKFFRFWIGYELGFVTHDAKYIEGIMNSRHTLGKNHVYDMLTPWIGKSLLLSTGSNWSKRRKIMAPTFNFKMMEQFVDIFDRQCRVMVKCLLPKADGETVVNMLPAACLLALDIIAEAAMGVKINAQENPNFPYSKALTDFIAIITDRFIKPFDRFDWFFRTFSNASYRKMKKSIKITHEFTHKVIEARRAVLQTSKVDEAQNREVKENLDMGIKEHKALLDVLLEAQIDGKPLTNNEIREEVDAFMFAGHDTTATGIAFTCYLLSRHPDIQEKVFQEIREVIGDDKDRPVGMTKLQDLKYLDCVIKESFRLYPPVPGIGRITEKDCIINGHTFPAKTHIYLPLYFAFRDPDYFSNPDEFIPERFNMKESEEKINQFSYIPFSAGPRNCIARKFAEWEMRSTLSKIIRNFELLPLGEEVDLVMNITLRSMTGINMGLRPRVY